MTATASGPFADDRTYLREELARLDCRLRIEVERFDGPIDEFGALYVSEAAVRRLLRRGREGTDGAVRVESEERQALARRTRALRERRRETAEAGTPLRIDRLAERFGLAPRDREALLLALAPELDATYATVYAYLQDDATRRRPTVGFLRGLLDDGSDRLERRSPFAAGRPLADADLVALDGDGPLPTREVRVDPRIVAYLLGEDAGDAAIADVAAVADPDTTLDDVDVSPAERTALARIADGDGRAPPMVAIHGPEGTRRGERAAALATRRGEGLVTVAAGRIAPDRFAWTLDRVAREARLLDAAVRLDGVLDDEERALEAIRRLDDLETAVVLTGDTGPSRAVRTAPARHEFVPVAVERVDYDGRRRYWAGKDLPGGVDPAVLASTFRLSRGQIDDAMAAARAAARATDEGPTAEHVYEACRAQSSEELADLATRIEPSYGWADIVLPAGTEARLREVAGRLTERGTVYADWGFAERSSLGNGLVALFSGPSGTGKTMAAEVVAGHAGLHLYKVDLAAVVSKYVGETESNLGRVFDEAADSDAVLLFDEADALFGERSEVSDAHDRYANIEVDYLLQRVEEHDGAVLLTTNLESNIDDAFLRRIHLAVDFPLPDRASRADIWRRVFPEETPVGDVDYDYLARLDLTGGSIRNVALTAAFFAAEAGTAVGMEQIVRAVKREGQKTGMPIDPDRFGEYREVVEAP